MQAWSKYFRNIHWGPPNPPHSGIYIRGAPHPPDPPNWRQRRSHGMLSVYTNIEHSYIQTAFCNCTFGANGGVWGGAEPPRYIVLKYFDQACRIAISSSNASTISLKKYYLFFVDRQAATACYMYFGKFC